MRIKRSLLLIGAALAAITVVLPATASAFTIKDNGKTLENVEIPLTGQFKFQSSGTGMECTVHMALFVNGNTVDVTKFAITTKSCAGFGSLYAGCEMSSDEATLPWSVTVHEENLEVPFGAVDSTLKAKPGKTCTVKESNITLKNAGFWWINDLGKTKRPYTAVEYIAAAVIDTNLGELSGEASGRFEFVEASAETYEIG